MKEKKKIKDTALGKFVTEKIPKLAGIIGDVLPDKGVLGVIKNLIDNDPEVPAEQKLEFERLVKDHEKEMFELEVHDRDSARVREVEIAKTGRSDWMMKLVGIWVLILTTWIIYAVFYTVIINSEMSHFIAGEVVGFAASVVMLYYGASQRSAKKA